MLKMNYGDIIHFLNELPKSEFYNNPEMAKQFVKKYKELQLREELMEKLETEHETILKTSDKCEATNFEGPFRYITVVDKELVAIDFPI